MDTKSDFVINDHGSLELEVYEIFWIYITQNHDSFFPNTPKKYNGKIIQARITRFFLDNFLSIIDFNPKYQIILFEL